MDDFDTPKLYTEPLIYDAGTQRRTKKVVHTHGQEVNEDKKLKSQIKKFGRCFD